MRYHCDTTLRGPLAMANLLVRNLDDAVLQELKAAAKAHGRSLQAEIHEVLRNASAGVSPKRDGCRPAG